MLAALLHPAALTGACAIGVALAAWGLRGRKPRHPECLRCRHDLTGIKSRRCPECGRVARGDRELTRRRRRRVPIVAGLAVALAGGYGLARRVPASWWLARTPTPILLLVAGRIFDEAMQRDIAEEMQDRLILSDGLLGWSRYDRLPGWEQEMVRSAIPRLESVLPPGERCLGLRRLAGLPLESPDFTLQPPTDAWLPGTPTEFVERLEAAMQAAPDRNSDEPDERSLALIRELRAIGIGVDVEIPIGDQASAYVAAIPVEGPAAERHAVLRFGLTRWEGFSLWLRREPDGRWRVAGRVRGIEGEHAYRAGPDNAKGHAYGDTLFLEEAYHSGGGSGFVFERTRVSDLARNDEVLDVPRWISMSMGGRGQATKVALAWPTAETLESLDAAFEVTHERADAVVAGASGVVTYRRAPDGRFDPHAVRWIVAPPGLDDRSAPPLFPILSWPTSSAELAALYDLPESTFEHD
jgi:hypothetical protein